MPDKIILTAVSQTAAPAAGRVEEFCDIHSGVFGQPPGSTDPNVLCYVAFKVPPRPLVCCLIKAQYSWGNAGLGPLNALISNTTQITLSSQYQAHTTTTHAFYQNMRPGTYFASLSSDADVNLGPATFYNAKIMAILGSAM